MILVYVDKKFVHFFPLCFDGCSPRILFQVLFTLSPFLLCLLSVAMGFHQQRRGRTFRCTPSQLH